VVEIQATSTFDRNKDGSVSEEEASFFLNLESEMSREEWVKNGWMLAKPYFLMERGLFTPPQTTTERPLQPTQEPEEEQDFEDDETDGGDSGEKEEPPLGEDHDSGNEESGYEQENNDKPKYDEKTMDLIRAADGARNEFNEADKTIRDISNKLEEVSDGLSLDFGEDERFSPLHGQCFDYEDREYVYTLCPFKDANQRGKNGGGLVNLGRWGSWSGSEENKFSQMLYEKGQSCWN